MAADPKRARVDAERSVVFDLSDGELAGPRDALARASETLRTLFDDDGDDDAQHVPLHQLSLRVFEVVVRWVRHHDADPMEPLPEPLPSTGLAGACSDPFDAQLLPDDDADLVVDVLLAANFLGVAPLRKLAAAKIAHLIRELPPSRVLELFGAVHSSGERRKAIVDANPSLLVPPH